MTLNLELDEQTVQQLEEQARRHGLPDAAAYARELIRSAINPAERKNKGEIAAERMRNTKTNGLTADELSGMTRS